MQDVAASFSKTQMHAGITLQLDYRLIKDIETGISL